jgi:hypothetical protein
MQSFVVCLFEGLIVTAVHAVGSRVWYGMVWFLGISSPY